MVIRDTDFKLAGPGAPPLPSGNVNEGPGGGTSETKEKPSSQ